MKGLIIYKSKYGATRQYANWLSNELRLEVREPEDVTEKELTGYDFFVIGSSVYIGKLLIQDWLKKHLGVLHNKKLFLFIVCATSANEQEKLNTIVNNNIPFSILNKATIHFLHGKMIVKELSWFDRLLLKMGARMEKDPKVKKSMLTDFNSVKKENIAGLVQQVNAFFNKNTKDYARQL